MITGWHKALVLLPCLALPGCMALDTEEAVREELGRYVFLGETRRFASRMGCTAAVFDLRTTGVRSGVAQVNTARRGLEVIREGQVVALDLPGLTPDAVSAAIMSISLEDGMGLVSSFIGPASDCMDDALQADAYLALTDSAALTIYAPQTNALMLMHKPSQLVFFLRGAV